MQQDKDILGRGKNSYKGFELEQVRTLWLTQNEQE